MKGSCLRSRSPYSAISHDARGVSAVRKQTPESIDAIVRATLIAKIPRSIPAKSEGRCERVLENSHRLETCLPTMSQPVVYRLTL